jgi:putative addiction module component (TIGR02574 family)
MEPALESIEAEALKLPQRERAKLAKSLLLSLNGRDEAGTDEVWAEEAERRYRELKEGTVQAIPSEEVFREARSRLR